MHPSLPEEYRIPRVGGANEQETASKSDKQSGRGEPKALFGTAQATSRPPQRSASLARKAQASYEAAAS